MRLDAKLFAYRVVVSTDPVAVSPRAKIAHLLSNGPFRDLWWRFAPIAAFDVHEIARESAGLAGLDFDEFDGTTSPPTAFVGTNPIPICGKDRFSVWRDADTQAVG